MTLSSKRSLANLTPRDQLRAGRLARRLPQLGLGLVLYGVSMAMMVRGRLGLAPWDVFHSGLAGRLPITFGTAVILTSAAVLLLWIPLRQMPGLGTLLNAVVIGLVADRVLAVLVAPGGWPARIGLLLAGVALNGLATALYIGAQFGPGPRDGLMTGLVRRTGRSLRLVRTGIEATVLVTGWLLGGGLGVGTLLYAVSIGPLIQLFLPHLIVDVGLTRRSGGAERRGSSSTGC